LTLRAIMGKASNFLMGNDAMPGKALLKDFSLGSPQCAIDRNGSLYQKSQKIAQILGFAPSNGALGRELIKMDG